MTGRLGHWIRIIEVIRDRRPDVRGPKGNQREPSYTRRPIEEAENRTVDFVREEKDFAHGLRQAPRILHVG